MGIKPPKNRVSVDTRLSSIDLDTFKDIKGVQDKFIKEAVSKLDEQLKGLLKDSLKELRFELSEFQFIEFISKRVTRVISLHKPNEWEIYLDYQTEKQKLLGLYSDSSTNSFEDSRTISTFKRYFWLTKKVDIEEVNKEQQVAQKIILALDEYGRKVNSVEYGLPILKDFNTTTGKEMVELVTKILKEKSV